jgi:predicted CXXCH cytochrome family protein
MTVKRFTLLVAAGVLWLFVAALPTFADGGPHVMTVNNGTSGINGDCASCHRAHTAQASYLLTADLPTLCTNCHNGTKATTDVIDGVQYTPTGTAGSYQQGTTVGALRGGGFNFALMGAPARLSIGGSQTIDLTGATAGTFTLTFKGQTTAPIAYNASAATVQAAIVALSSVGTDTTYSGSGASGMTGTHPENITVSLTGTVYSLTMQNTFRLAVQPLFTGDATALTGLASIKVTDTTQSAVRSAGFVGVGTSAATTSTHGGVGTVWGNGAVNTGAGVAGVTLECANCHNPHGNGQYRILQTVPGADWTSPSITPNNAGGVEVADVAPAANTILATQVRNYSVLPSTNGLTTGVVGTSAQGDYWRYKFDPSGTTNFTNFYLSADPMNTGWNGVSAVNKASNGNVAPANTSGLMTAWCIQCHSRYNGYSPTGTTSIQGSNPADSLFMYKHGTTRIGCEQCHVSHGTDVAMTTAGSLSVNNPDGTPGGTDSRLLKVSNRGTCNLCHDPTGTVVPGTKVGTIPGAITPGP